MYVCMCVCMCTVMNELVCVTTGYMCGREEALILAHADGNDTVRMYVCMYVCMVEKRRSY